MRTSIRAKVCALARGIASRLEDPNDAILQVQFQPAVATALRVALDAGWIQPLRDGQTHEASTLLQQGQGLELLVRIFRVLVAAGLVKEVGELRYQANAKTIRAADPGVRAGLAHWFDNMAPAFTSMPEYFRSKGYDEPQEQEAGPYAHVFNKTYWNRLESEPPLYQDLNTYMSSHKKAGTSLAALVPKDALLEGFDQSVSDVLLIDIGGGKGHQLKDLASQYSSLPGRLIVQDLPGVLPKEEEVDGFECMPQNFFEPQTVHGARYYYFSAILHDWPDHACEKILRQTVQAMVPGYSRILLNGIILPNTGASLFEACKDFGMMAAMSGKERTLKQIEALCANVGLRMSRRFEGPRGRDGILEFELPKDPEPSSRPRSSADGKSDKTG